MMDAKTYWNEYFSKDGYTNAKAPNKFLVEMFPRMQKGKILDLAMGDGVNAVYLAQKGFQVEGFDVSDVAITKAKQLAKDTGVNIDARSCDLDLYLMPLMHYDSIVMLNFKPQLARFNNELIRGLKQGGTVLIASYSAEEMPEAIGRDETYKDFYYHANELLKNLTGLRILFYQESLVDGKHVVQCLAQKPFDKDALKYNLFDMHADSGQENKKSRQLELAEQLFKK